MSQSGAEIHRSENQQKVIQDRITTIEDHLGKLCDITSSYTRKTARLRDKGDLLAQELMKYSEFEKWNPSMRNGMSKFAESLSAVQDYREAEVKRLESKIMTPLMNYGLRCKQTKNELKDAFAARDREQTQKRKVETVKAKNPNERQKIAQLENELQKASINATRSGKALEQEIDKFEADKLKDLKKLMKNFVTIEMHFHAKALELYTQCFQTIEVIDPDADLEEFRHQLRPDGSIRSYMARSASQASLESRQNSSGNTTPRKPPLVKQPTPIGTRRKISAPPPLDLPSDSEDDEDDDDDSEEDETEPQPRRR